MTIGRRATMTGQVSFKVRAGHDHSDELNAVADGNRTSYIRDVLDEHVRWGEVLPRRYCTYPHHRAVRHRKPDGGWCEGHPEPHGPTAEMPLMVRQGSPELAEGLTTNGSVVSLGALCGIGGGGSGPAGPNPHLARIHRRSGD